jgi:hypothetical protein
MRKRALDTYMGRSDEEAIDDIGRKALAGSMPNAHETDALRICN